MCPQVTSATPDSARLPARYALQIAVDHYKYSGPFLPNLSGCANDILAMKRLLISRFGFDEARITTLIDEQATRQAIFDAWQALIDKAADGDICFIQYSGHGSQMRDLDGDEEDGLDETILPHDTRDPGRTVFDITDDEIQELVEALAAKTDHIVILFDCCHSASSTRALGQPLEGVRRVPADAREPPQPRALAPARLPVTKGPSGWLPQIQRVVFMAGCRDTEEANEYRSPEGVRYGALTYFLLQALANGRPEDVWRDVFDVTAAQVASHFNQHPQIEGARDRAVFGGEWAHETNFFYVSPGDPAAGSVRIAGGAAHGLHSGSQLAIYPPQTHDFSDPSQRLALVTIEEVGATTSLAHLPVPIPIPERARAIEIVRNYGNPRLRVAIVAGDAQQAARDAFVARFAQSALLQIVEPGDGPAAMVIVLPSVVSVVFPDGRPLTAPQPLAGGEEIVVADLEAVARFQNALNLDYPGTALRDQVTLALVQAAATPGAPAMPLPRTAGGELAVGEGTPFAARISNRGARDLYVTLLAFTPDWQISQVYPPPGAEAPVSGGRSFEIPFDSGSRVTRLPYGAEKSTTIFKLFVTTVPTDLSILTQQGQSVQPRSLAPQPALERLAREAGTGLQAPASRAVGPAPAGNNDQAWATLTLPLVIQRPGETATLTATLLPGQEHVAAGVPGVSVDKAAGQHAVWRWGTWSLPRRAIRVEPMPPPPPALTIPGVEPYIPPGLRSAATRALGQEPEIAYVDIDDMAGAPRPDAPLRVHLPADDDETGVVAIATDGEAYYPVGTIEDFGARRAVSEPAEHTLSIDWLPQGPTTRGLGRTIRLYLYKISKLSIPDVGLRHARLDDKGDVVYTPVQAGDLDGIAKVGLFIHGFTSDTRWMVHGPATWLNAAQQGYHVLTFDYETFNTPVLDNAQKLHQALVQAGFRDDDGRRLDLFVHSLGSLVARGMIEKWGGAAFSDRLVMAGGPNSGTPLAGYGKKFVVWLGSVLLNATTPSIPALIGSWLLKQAVAQAVTVSDMIPGSPLLTTLNSLQKPDNVSYLVLAGRNELAPGGSTWAGIAHKIFDAGLDVIFKGQNDLAVGVQSAEAVRGGTYPRLTHQELPCDHFGYYGLPQGQEAILAWLRSNA